MRLSQRKINPTSFWRSHLNFLFPFFLYSHVLMANGVKKIALDIGKVSACNCCCGGVSSGSFRKKRGKSHENVFSSLMANRKHNNNHLLTFQAINMLEFNSRYYFSLFLNWLVARNIQVNHVENLFGVFIICFGVAHYFQSFILNREMLFFCLLPRFV